MVRDFESFARLIEIAPNHPEGRRAWTRAQLRRELCCQQDSLYVPADFGDTPTVAGLHQFADRDVRLLANEVAEIDMSGHNGRTIRRLP